MEPAKKKQRYSSMDRAKKDELLETCAKKYKEMDTSKTKQCLKNRREKYEQMDVSPKKQLLNKIAEHSRKRYHSMDCKKKEKHQHKKKSISNSLTDQKNFRVLIMYAVSVTGCFIENLY